jgi:hypothetical protein
MSVIGFDDDRLARLSHVALTTVAQDTEQITTLAIARAVARLDGTTVSARELVIPPRLVVRGTTAAPPGSPTPDGQQHLAASVDRPGINAPSSGSLNA